MESPLLRALRSARPDLPGALARFDIAARSAGPPSFEEYSARVGDRLAPWRLTLYFDRTERGREPDTRPVEATRAPLQAAADALGFTLPPPLLASLLAGLGDGLARDPAVLQEVLGVDAGLGGDDPEDPRAATRLKYYLVFCADSSALVERLRRALAAPPLPPVLAPGRVYILGLDLGPRGLLDFKIYVRLDPARAPAVLRDLRSPPQRGERGERGDSFAALYRGSRDLVFLRCLVGGGSQLYFHARSSAVCDVALAARAARGEPAVIALQGQVAAMNRALAPGLALRPWIISVPVVQGLLQPAPTNVYFHLERRRERSRERGDPGSEDEAGSQGLTPGGHRRGPGA